MTFWLSIFGIMYIALLVFAANSAKSKNKDDADEVLLARSGVPTLLLFISFSATLFSTFTLMGVPEFFRSHGVGTWLFIGVTDVAMGFVVYWFGVKYKKTIDSQDIRSVSSLLKSRYSGNLSWLVYLAGVFVFLAPYVAIQIQGVSQLLTALAPADIPSWVWAVAMLSLILIYSWVGGLRAIMYSDVAQGIILLFVIWIVAILVTQNAGGLSNIFNSIRQTSPELLTTPGPKGLMNFQFLIASFFAILWMPITQPQLTTRIASAKSVKEIPMMALGISFFALIILLPTIVIGFVGAIDYAGLSSGQFLAHVLVIDRPEFIGALAVIGLLAAAMSTADSQLFALGAESQIALSKNENKINLNSTKIVIIAFSAVCFILSLLSSSELVLLARVSFAGTAIIGPMIVLALFSKEKLGVITPIITAIALMLFLIASFKLIPSAYFGVRIDLILMFSTAVIAFLQYFKK